MRDCPPTCRGRRGPANRCAPSTVARELKRNGSRSGGYRSVYAHEQARARRWTGARLERDDELRACVLERLSWGWSPEQIAGHLAEAAGRTVISYESIYRFIYAQAARHKNHAWRRYLPRAKWKRGRRRRKGSSSASFIAHRRPAAERPAAAADRQTFGHWEADTMLFGRSGEVVLALHERLSRLVLMARVPSKAAGPIAETIARVLGPLPRRFARRSPSTMGPSSPATTSSTTSASRPSSATVSSQTKCNTRLGCCRGLPTALD